MTTPKISFLISSYDSGQYLDRRLHNLLKQQTMPEVEAIIVVPDSPGTDDHVADKWANLEPERVNHISVSYREPYGASWLRAWMQAKAPIVVNANADDLLYARFSEVVFREFTRANIESKGRIGFAYTGIHVVDEASRTLGQGIKPHFDREVMSRECWAGPSVAWRNDQAFRNSLDWDLMHGRSLSHQNAFDYWLWLYFMSLGYDGLSIQEILTIYTQRPGSIENRNKWQNNYETYASISEFFPHNFLNHLKHAREFADFNNLPPKEEWIETMKAGGKWK